MNLVRVSMVLLVVAMLFLSLPTLEAQNNAIVPNANATTEGTGATQEIFFVNGSATVQLFFDSTQITNFASGDQINGMAVRLDAGETTNGAFSYTQFDIEFSEADSTSTNQGLLGSTTFATNQGSTPVTVRSGSLTIAAGALTDGASPNAFSYYIPFTSPYTHNPGSDVVVTIHMAGSSAGAILDTVDTNQAHLIDWIGHLTSNTATVATTVNLAAPVIELISEPEVNLLFASTGVANGDTHPLGAFGYNGSAFTHTLTIENTGVEDLTITTPLAAPTALVGCTASIATQPGDTVSAGGTTTFGLLIRPNLVGAYSCTISFASNDRDENPYTITVTGTAAAAQPEMDVFRGVATAIADASTDSIGDRDYGISQTVTYRIENNGLSDLNLSSAPVLTITTGANIRSVLILSEPTGSIPAGTSDTFSIVYVITGSGAWDFHISIGNDDPDENPYNWTVSGTSTNQGFVASDDDDDESCSTNDSGSKGWLLLLGALSAVIVVTRTRKAIS